MRGSDGKGAAAALTGGRDLGEVVDELAVSDINRAARTRPPHTGAPCQAGRAQRTASDSDPFQRQVAARATRGAETGAALTEGTRRIAIAKLDVLEVQALHVDSGVHQLKNVTTINNGLRRATDDSQVGSRDVRQARHQCDAASGGVQATGK